MYPYQVLVYAWLATFGAAYFITNASLLFPWRIRIHERQMRHAERRAGDIHSMAPDTPGKIRNEMRTRYWMRIVLSEYPFCMVCVGLGAWIVGLTVAWSHLRWPLTVWGTPAWLSIPAALSAGWLLMLVLLKLLPSVGWLSNRHGVEEQGGPSA